MGSDDDDDDTAAAAAAANDDDDDDEDEGNEVERVAAMVAFDFADLFADSVKIISKNCISSSLKAIRHNSSLQSSQLSSS